MRPPNFVFILLDDLGVADLGCQGSTFYETPHLDRLALDGMRFQQAYAACPVCSPTRASLLTGRYPARVGVTNYIDSGGRSHPSRGRLVDAPYVPHLPREEIALPKPLRAAGYQTWHVGKWHLGGPGFGPEDHGFEVNLAGCDWGHPSRGYFSPWGIPTLADGEPGEYLTDHLTDQAIRLIRERGDRPFFLNLWHYAVHTPIQAPEPLVEKYRRKARALRLDGINPFVDGGPFPTEHKRHQRIQRRVVQSDPAYAAMIENLDSNVGRLLAVLDETGLARDTVVIFTSDNGGLATSEGSPTCNAPWAEGKGWMQEGGVREPFIVRWPAVIAPGRRCDAPICSPDLYPTLLELAGLPPLPEQHCDGLSLAPLFRGADSLSPRPLFWHYPHYGNQGSTPGSSVRWGDWKLIEWFEDGRRALYRLNDDISEARDLSADLPERTAELAEMLGDWRRTIGAPIPQPNPAWQE